MGKGVGLLRILFLQESDWLQRYSAQQHHLAELMSLRGHEIRVIDYEIKHKLGGYAKRMVYPDVSKIYSGAKVTVVRPAIIQIPCMDYLSLLFSHRRELANQLQEFRPDVVVGFGILNSYLASAMVGATPFVYYWIDVLHELIPQRFLRFVGKSVEEVALRRADKVLAINQRLGYYVNYLGAAWRKVEVLGAAVDPKRFNCSISGQEIRERHKFKDDDIVLFFMGWLYRFSGLVEVMTEMARNRNPHLKLLIVGEGDAYVSLCALQAKLELYGLVNLVGKKEYKQIPSYIAASNICILPAYPDHRVMKNIVPIKIYEYMAMGKPVIATMIPAVMEEFGNGRGIWYVRKPEDVVAESLRIVTNGELEKLGRQAKDAISSWDVVVSRFEKILQEVLKEKHSG